MKYKDDISVLLSGAAGQGLKTVEKILMHILKNSGYNVFSVKEYMSRIRGGNNTTEIRISSEPVGAHRDKIDILLPLNPSALERISGRISDDTLIIGDEENLEEAYRERRNTFIVSINKAAKDIGRPVYATTLAAGLISGMLNADKDIAEETISRIFSAKGDEVVQKNIEALRAGISIAGEVLEKNNISFDIKQDDAVKAHLLLNGVDAVGMGALAGGCNFISAYPMSPSTGLLLFLCENAEEFNIIAEQAEDEISAVNMAVGAWYAGGRALANTSGGGFALMEEGVSLAAMTETPLVVHLAQRPGPATGLPTRTAQEDLNLVLYSGHGEFPRAVYAPGSFQQAAEVSCRAFNTADKYQVPAFILTDQYFLDAYMNLKELTLDSCRAEYHIRETAEGYRRYKLSGGGVSPRGVPGFGDGLVCADSDEHDEDGHITEDLRLRIKMNDKRINKLTELRKEAIEPELTGPEDYRLLVVSWGSNYHVIKEALKNISSDGISFLHFSQVYPLHASAGKYLKKASKVAVVENNASGQFAELLKKETGISSAEKILKYNGLPFSVEELTEKLKSILKGEK